MTITYLGNRSQPVDPTARRTPLAITSAAVSASQLTISVLGDIDAGNVKSFADRVCALVADDRGGCLDVCLDLSEVGFFAVDACTALHAINAAVMRGGGTWAVVVNRGVGRVLELCDPAGLIPRIGDQVFAKPA